MEFRASHRGADISPRKARLVVALVRGKHVNDALQILRSTPNRAAKLVDKVLRSAIANADESLEAQMDSLRVKETWVDKGGARPWMRRKWRPRARGRAAPIRIQHSHINIVLDDGQRQEES